MTVKKIGTAGTPGFQGGRAAGSSGGNAAGAALKSYAFVDGSDLYLADKKIVIMFESMATGIRHSSLGDYNASDPLAQEAAFANIAVFKSFVTSFSDNFSSDWTATMVFGRNDPIYNFKATQRSLSLVFDVVATDLNDAMLNLTRVSRLAKMLYPAYSAPTDIAANLTRPPLVKVKFANLIADHSYSDFESSIGGSPSTANGGLLGVIKSLTITPNFDAGVFDGPGNSEIYPKIIGISLDFGVLHQGPLGWNADSEVPTFVGDGYYPGPGMTSPSREFPYGATSPVLSSEVPTNPPVNVLDPAGGEGESAEAAVYDDYNYGDGPLADVDYESAMTQAYFEELESDPYGDFYTSDYGSSPSDYTGLEGEPGYGVMEDY